MNNVNIVRKKQKIDNLLELAKQLPTNPELMSHWAKYLCVLVCGLLETSVRELYQQLPVGKSTKEVVRYVGYSLQKIPNPRFDVLVKLANQFSEDWRQELAEMEDTEIGLAVTSVVSNRINIAHGRDSNVSIQNIKEWYPQIINFIEIIEDQTER